MTLQPLADRLVAKQVKAEEKTASGFYIPDSAKEKPRVAEVISVGTEVKDLKVGDHIVYSERYEGSKEVIRLDNEELIIIKEADVLAIATR